MSNTIISIIIPGIRTYNWNKIYESIKKCQYTFEIIFVGPAYLPQELQNIFNIHFYQDFGSPNRCQQIGMCLSSGKYVHWMADDGIVNINVLNKCIDILEQTNNHKEVLTTKYTEGNNIIQDDKYYLLCNSYPKSPYISSDWLILNSAILYRSYFEYLGGWDCSFDVTCLAHADLAVRAQIDGCTVTLIQESLADYGHMPNITGDHAPVHYSQIQYDEPLFRQIYNNKECLNRIRIDINNWKNSDDIWTRRFSV